MEALITAAILAVLAAVATVLALVFGVDIDIGVSPLRFKVSRKDKPDGSKPAARPPDGILPPAEPPAPASPSPVERERDQLREALFAFKLATEGLQAIMTSSQAECESRSRDWFDALEVLLSQSLRTSMAETYRVAFWVSGADPDQFDALGHGTPSINRPRRKRLPRQRTIGGDAFTSTAGEVYCANIKECGWLPIDNPHPRYASLFAVALGEPPRWGVMTVDCNLVDGFSEADMQIARHFSELATIGRAAKTVVAQAGGTIVE